MTIRVAITHKTHYQFDRLVELSPHVLRLRPAIHSRTPIEAYSLRIQPDGHFINWQQDPFGNFLARVVFPEKTRELSFEVDVIADMTVINPFDFFVEDYAENYPFSYPDELRTELAPYLEIREDGPRLRAWMKAVDRSGKGIVDFLVGLNQQLYQHVAYNVRMEPGVQTCEDTLATATGSCRDSAWLLVQILRHLGFAARFVSGYLVQLTADVKALDGPSGTDKDFTDLHAWAELYIPGAGWVGLDATSGLFAGEGHIPLACTPNPGSAAPISGATSECKVDFSFSNKVQRIHEDPRVTKPYTDAQWSIINALGDKVDAELVKGDVRLTMGGEPTFVSIDDMEGAEWNTAAFGPHKRKLASDLLQRLWPIFAPGALLHYGQGKWYPAEPLPRWALTCLWRADGKPLWRDPALLAGDLRDYGHTQADAARFISALAERLGVGPETICPAYEDRFHYLWKETQVPLNLEPNKAEQAASAERRRLAALLQKGLDQPVGCALPLRWNEDQDRWYSVAWELRTQHLFLVPGDSPMGLRLPLDTLPWVAPEKREAQHAQSLFAPLPPLGDYYGEIARRYSSLQADVPPHPEIQQQPPADDSNESCYVDVPHTAICVEARAGRLHIFMPPLTHLEHYLDLVSNIESVAAELQLPVILEGYEPPADYRLRKFAVTPDPGVIEVNIHPANSWRELVATTTILYEEAHQARLGAEKFMLDGRHTGTGGGNHITLGGATPSDSPLLRRPDLLRSLITFWQHHPGLSYLFSGMFIGPTSQAPRVDEGRDERLYELEIAFAQMPAGEVPQPWLVDRLLRHLLVDITGNTHRSEFCVDKLYSPDSATGRLGLLEFRGFEMPPHARMSLVQMLLVRTLIARFWKKPYAHPLVRWGTALHDRFMLPHFVWADIADVVADLQREGYPFQLEWLAPFQEFRFPQYGRVSVQDIQLEVRMAIEPWHVLGEEVSQSGTARYVDSSVERVQIKLTGLTDSRYVVACNGRRAPLHSTGTHGEYVAGVRYRAWQPPSALHPTIGVHAPLVFDIIDSWNGRAIGGCTYHVTHPGGRNYAVFPINAYAAEARRISRFWGYGHTPGRVEPPADIAALGEFFKPGQSVEMAAPIEERNPEYPYTLDLRRPLG